MPPPLIRLARSDDLDALTELYNHYVAETPITFDIDSYTVETRRPWFEQFSSCGPYQLWIAEDDGALLGYAASVRYRPKAAYQTTIETSIYLSPGATGRGVGTRLYTALFGALRGQDLHRALAGITLPNPGSLALHRRMGFEQVALFREVGRKFGRYWDVAWFEKALA